MLFRHYTQRQHVLLLLVIRAYAVCPEEMFKKGGPLYGVMSSDVVRVAIEALSELAAYTEGVPELKNVGYLCLHCGHEGHADGYVKPHVLHTCPKCTGGYNSFDLANDMLLLEEGLR